jgi:hypothetical protein
MPLARSCALEADSAAPPTAGGEARALQVLDQALGNELRHDLIGVVMRLRPW